MAFPGTWMTESEKLIYRVIPKCACSSIGQAMYYSDHARYFDGDIHDTYEGIHKWAMEESRPIITRQIDDRKAYVFTCVRNPYGRILSAFFDKIAGIQRNGNRYRGNLVPRLTAQYGVQVEGDFDQITSFRRFLLFARDTIRFGKPMAPDIHWSSISGHVSTFIANGGRYNNIFFLEDFNAGMKNVFSQVELPNPVEIDAMPRFNESEGHGPKRAHPVEDYFDDLSLHIVKEIYHRDFDLFRYSEDPAQRKPIGEIDLDRVHIMLSGN